MASNEPLSTTGPAKGSEVKDSLGKHIGTVSGSGESYFKIDVRHARDYWLPLDVVAKFDSDLTELRFPEDELGSYKQYSGIEELPEGELDGQVSLTEGAEAVLRHDGAQLDFLEGPR